MLKTNALIVAAQTQLSFTGFESFYKIGVERGCLDLIAKHIKINTAIADFDQVVDEELGLIKNNCDQLIILDEAKDLLDGEHAIMWAQGQGFKNITFVTKPTKRYDMNLSVLWLVQKYNVKILNDNSLVFKILAGTFQFDHQSYQDYTYVTFFPLAKTVITLTQFKYNVTDLVLQPYEIRAYSNQFIPFQDGVVSTTTDMICILTK